MWLLWSIGKPASITGDIYDPQAPAELSTALLGEEGSRLPACGVCTHLATGIATAADGTSYVTVMMAGRDSGRQLTEAEMAAAEAEMTALVNELRSSLGLNTVAYDPGVAAAARRWSQIMGAGFHFNHNPHAGADYPTGYRFNGENVALNKLTTTTTDAVQQSFGDFANSPCTTRPWSIRSPPTSASASSSKPDGYGSPRTSPSTREFRVDAMT